MLQINGLNKSFGKKKVLTNFTYDFNNGIYGLLGPNGAGKTTLLRCLTKLYRVKNGEIMYQGTCVNKNKAYLSAVGYLPQKFGLFKELTVMEAMQLLANLKDIDGQQAKRMAKECIELVHLSDRLHDRVGTLSGGMVRRLGIAQALLGNPKIVIFDEPTAGLDPEERLRFKNIISRIKSNRIIIISTHIVEDVEATCDTVLVMKNGAVAASGNCAEVAKIANEKVYIVPEAEQKNVAGEFLVQKRIENENGQPFLKILSNTPQCFEQTAPTVEDGYICVLKNI